MHVNVCEPTYWLDNELLSFARSLVSRMLPPLSLETLEVNPSSNVVNCGCFADFYNSTVVFYLNMKQEILAIPDSLHLELISTDFVNKFGHVNSDRKFLTDRSITNHSTGQE